MALAVKLNVSQHKVYKVLDLLESNVQAIFKRNDKMQETREIERPSSALKLSSTLRTILVEDIPLYFNNNNQKLKLVTCCQNTTSMTTTYTLCNLKVKGLLSTSACNSMLS